MPAPLAYSIADAAKIIGGGRSSIYSEIREGRLKARKFRGRTIILHEDLTEYLRGLPTTDRVVAGNEPVSA